MPSPNHVHRGRGNRGGPWFLAMALIGCASRAPHPTATAQSRPEQCVHVATHDSYLFRDSTDVEANKWGDSFLPPDRVGQPLPPSEQWVLPCVSMTDSVPPAPSVDAKQLSCVLAVQRACLGDGGTSNPLACAIQISQRCGLEQGADAGRAAHP